MTAIDINAIRQREQAATKGPWTLRDGWGPARDGLARCSRIANKQHDNVLHPEGRDIAGTVADLEFIAAARTDVPALLAKVDELTAKIEDRRLRLVEAEADLLNLRGILSPNGYPQRVPVDLVPTVAPAVRWLADRVDELTAALAERDAQLTAANRRADGLQNDLRSAIKGNTAWANQRETFRAWDHCGPGGASNPHPLHHGKTCEQYDQAQAATR